MLKRFSGSCSHSLSRWVVKGRRWTKAIKKFEAKLKCFFVFLLLPFNFLTNSTRKSASWELTRASRLSPLAAFYAFVLWFYDSFTFATSLISFSFIIFLPFFLLSCLSRSVSAAEIKEQLLQRVDGNSRRNYLIKPWRPGAESRVEKETEATSVE